MIVLCACGCGQEFDDTKSRGELRRFYSKACKQRQYNRNKRDVNRNIDTSLINQIITGDCRELAKQIPDNSIDLIFTDPPYPKEFLPLYGWLAKEAVRVLKPGGFLLTYAGNMYKDRVMAQLGQHLNYFWDYVAMHAGMGTMVWPKNTVARHKSILAYVKGTGKPRCRTLGAFTGSGTDKRFHAWGQDEQTARYYIDCFTLPGQVVWEPFVGGGTTCFVAAQLKRNFIAFEINPDTANVARKRLATMQPMLIDHESVEQSSFPIFDKHMAGMTVGDEIA